MRAQETVTSNTTMRREREGRPEKVTDGTAEGRGGNSQMLGSAFHKATLCQWEKRPAYGSSFPRRDALEFPGDTGEPISETESCSSLMACSPVFIKSKQQLTHRRQPIMKTLT